jgi:hypothetical protein
MKGLIEWHHGTHAGLQLFVNPPDAGKGNMTLIVSDLSSEHSRLEGIGFQPAAIESGSAVRFFRMMDPCGNRIVLAEIPGASFAAETNRSNHPAPTTGDIGIQPIAGR